MPRIPSRFAPARPERIAAVRFNSFDLDYLMGWVSMAEGEPEKALDHLPRAGQAQPRRPALQVQIGEALGALRRWPAAEQAFRRALAVDPLDPHALLGLAKACLRQMRVEEGVDAALTSIGCLYQNPMAHYILGLGLLRMKQYLRAAEGDAGGHFHQSLTDNQRAADGDNPRGYFELDAATRLRQDKEWLEAAKGKANRSLV